MLRQFTASSTSATALIITTAGSSWRVPIARRSSRPSIFGMRRSLRTSVTSCDSSCASASRPLPASRHAKPSPRIRCTMTWRSRGSSSTIRQYGAADPGIRSSVTTFRAHGYLPHTSRNQSIGMTRVFDEDLATGFGTRAIHAGQRPEPLAGAIMTPVYLTSTYVQEGLGRNKGYEYSRGTNPTREAFERNVAALENGTHGFAFSSGMGCLDSIMKLFRAGDHIVCGENVYGGTFRLFDKILQHMGLSFSYVDTRDPQRIADAMTAATRAIIVETPSNPLMRLTDIAAAAEIAHRGDALLVVDNTFASPYFQQPLDLGADIVFHSTTKYLNGHSDMVGGCAVVRDDDLAERLKFIHNAAGAVAGPFDA